VRVDVIGALGVVDGDRGVRGTALGGRRARVALAALALSDRALSADHLASLIWGDELPPTWQVALRGVVRGLRTACAPVGGGAQQLIATVPSGYQLGEDIDVDVRLAAAAVARAAALLEAARHQAAIEAAEPVSRMQGGELLPDEDADWLAPHRRDVDALAMRAMEIVVDAAGALGEHDRAIAAARRVLATDPYEERAHRALIGALDRAGDRASALVAFEQCRTALTESLGVEPSAQTVDAYLAALGEETSRPAAAVPSTGSSFVGRELELDRVAAALATPGLLTIVGRGGVGKSRLAECVAAQPAFAGHRLWVSLAPVAQDELVAATVALDIGIAAGTDGTAAVAEHLAPLGRMLLVLDGCEVVVDGVASLTSALTAACPSLTILVTSRMPLGVDGERVVALDPLPAPAHDDADALRRNVQVMLLADRMSEGGGHLTFDDQLAPLLATLVRRCGGLPLALELVAAQLTAIPFGDLLDHLDVVADAGDDELRSLARSTYALLAPDEAAVFRRLGVLDGSVGLPLVRAVVATEPVTTVRVVRILHELANRGLVTVDRSGPRWRYRQDDDLHRFARELLVEHDEEAGAFDRLASAIRAVLPDDARAAPAPFEPDVSAMLGSVRSLFAAGLAGCADVGRCRELAFRLHRYFAATDVSEGRFWLDRLLAARPDDEWTPYATFALGYLSYWSGDTDTAIRELERAVFVLEGEDDSYTARALIYLAGLLDDVDRGDDAIEHVRRAIVAAAPFEIDLQVSAAMGMGSLLAEHGDPAATGYAVDTIALCRDRGSAQHLALALPTAAMVCWQVGAFEQCRAFIAEARPMYTDARRIARVVLLSATAGLALTDGDLDAAVEVGTLADIEATELHVEREAPQIRAVLARALLAIGDVAGAVDRTLRAIDAAAAMGIWSQLAICFDTAGLVAAAAGAPDGDVARLLASAAALRDRGGRRPLPALAGPVETVRARVGSAVALDVAAATGAARDLLGAITAVA
jgi:predicted ATPase